MTFIWARELSVGNKILDAIHKELHGMIGRITRLVIARDVTALLEAFELLENCLCAYFVVEENIAQAVEFDFTQHRLAHQHLLNEFKCMRDELTAKNGVWSKFEEKGYIDSLKNGLIRHIKMDGEPLKIVLETHFYDLKP